MTRPIGVFDSGLGGLTVAREILRRLPNESIIYFADTLHVPYGERPLKEIESFAVAISQFLISRGAKAIVMACNMSSAVGLEASRRAFPDVPMLGMISAGSRAVVATGAKNIGVLATTGTTKSGAYGKAIRTLAPQAVVWEQACPAFVPLIESGKAESEEAGKVVRQYIEPLLTSGTQAMVLGCTHYPFLRLAIERVAQGVTVVDPAEETVSQLHNTLTELGIAAEDSRCVEHQFSASGEIKEFARLGSKFLGRPIENVEQVFWGKDLILDPDSQV